MDMKKSNNLRVLVHKNGKQSVNMTMPIFSVTIIDTLMPDSVLEQLESKNIDIKAIINRVKESNYEPQTLFEQEADVEGVHKKYKVWIE